jgi:membrane-associated PAP2 superfamily phosphatase
MDGEGSLPHLQVPATGLYPDQDKFSTHPHIQFLMYILTSFSHVYQCFPGGHFSSDFLTKSLYVFIISCMHVTYPSYLILLHLVTSIINCTISINIGLIFR